MRKSDDRDPVIDIEQLVARIQTQLRSLGTQRVRAEILNVRSSSDGGFQLEVGSASSHLKAYLPGREKPRLNEKLAKHHVDCDELLRRGHDVELSGDLKFTPTFNQVELVVSDLGPDVSAGTVARRLHELRQRLQQEGLRPQPKSRPFAPLRIGVISGRAAAGLEDFLAILERSGFAFELQQEFVPLEGPMASAQCCSALDRLARTRDLIVMVRGGGSSASFVTFDSEPLVRAVSQCRVPVLCGTGHERNQCLTDEYAFASLVSPSDAANTVVGFCDADERSLITTAATAHRAVDAALTRMRRFRTGLFAGLAGFTVLVLLALLRDPVFAIILVALALFAWLAYSITNWRGSPAHRIASPVLATAGDGLGWLETLPSRIDGRRISNVDELHALVEAVCRFSTDAMHDAALRGPSSHHGDQEHRDQRASPE